MPIITLSDQNVLIKSHMASIERAMSKGDPSALGMFYHAIATAATVAAEYADDMAASSSDLPSVEPSHVRTDLRADVPAERASEGTQDPTEGT